ncbi:hypothetical protein Tco_0915605 [Tanacetum coccineum]
MKSVSMKQRLAGKKSLKKKWMQKESVSKQGRKPAKAEPTVHKDPAFDDLDDIVDDAMDYMESEDAQDEGRTSSVVLEEKESAEKGVSTEDQVSTIKPDEGTDKPKGSTDKPEVMYSDNAKKKVEVYSTNKLDKGKFDKLTKDEEIARKAQEDWEAEEEMKKLAEEEATKAVLIQDFIMIFRLRLKTDRLLAANALKRKEEKHLQLRESQISCDNITSSKSRFLAQQRAAAIRSRPPTRTQLRNQMMTYLKHVGGKKHADLKNKQIKELNEESKDPKKKRVVNETPREEDTTKVPAEQEVAEQGTKKRKSSHVKMIARKRPKPQPDDDSDDEHKKCLRIVTFDSTLDSEIMETKSFVSKLHKVSSPDGDYLVVYRVNGHFRAFNYLMEHYLEITPKVLIDLWGDLKIMMESSTEENDEGNFWNNQQEWEIVRWRLYEACRVCILELKDGTIIYMLVERRYLLSKESLQRMLDLGLEIKEESTVALHLVRFIKQQLNEE